VVQSFDFLQIGKSRQIAPLDPAWVTRPSLRLAPTWRLHAGQPLKRQNQGWLRKIKPPELTAPGPVRFAGLSANKSWHLHCAFTPQMAVCAAHPIEIVPQSTLAIVHALRADLAVHVRRSAPRKSAPTKSALRRSLNAAVNNSARRSCRTAASARLQHAVHGDHIFPAVEVAHLERQRRLGRSEIPKTTKACGK